FDLVSDFVDKYKQDLHKDKIRFRHIGRKERLPKELSKKLIDLEKQTKNYDEFNVQLYLDYGGRDELLRAINKLLKSERFRNKNNSPILEGGRGRAISRLGSSRDGGGVRSRVGGGNTNLRKKNKEITEEEFKKYLDTNSIPDPDLIIRTSGEYRLSGFMPFQSTYSELYFTDKHFPDFNTAELRKAIQEFSKRKRRFGGDKNL
ncbi:MAG: undecaprenyl diphosphate synthase family protein, partial [Candidatus Diapherotrites archaeon]|nr:undecaprenyl diphosphate synthase family protein [Candidatus Diapherotrites archaeon]